jgi:hypothetical protein
MCGKTQSSKLWISIDIGIIHMGVVCGLVNHMYDLIDIKSIQLLDIRTLIHGRIPREKCQLLHTRDILDRVSHFIQELQPIFDSAAHILIERQPFQGLTAVEKLIYQKVRHKATLVHPTSMHRFFGIPKGVSYEKRKEIIEGKSYRYLTPCQIGEMVRLERSHDIADAVCLLVFALDQRKKALMHNFISAKHAADQENKKFKKKSDVEICQPKLSEQIQIQQSSVQYFLSRSKILSRKEMDINYPYYENKCSESIPFGGFSSVAYFAPRPS